MFSKGDDKFFLGWGLLSLSHPIQGIAPSHSVFFCFPFLAEFPIITLPETDCLRNYPRSHSFSGEVGFSVPNAGATRMTSAEALVCDLSYPVPQVNGSAVDNWMTLQRTKVYQGFLRSVRLEPELRVSGNASLGTDVSAFGWGSGGKRAITHWLTLLVRVFSTSRTGFADIIHRELWGFP